MFTQEEFESAYEIISGFNNIRKQINEDPELLKKLYEAYRSIENCDEVDGYFKSDIQSAVLDCYYFLGYPHEYNRNVFKHFDLLTQAFLDNEKELSYAEYENIWNSPNYVREREYYYNIFNICDKYSKTPTLARLYTNLLKTDKYIAETFLILIKQLVFQLKESQYVTSEGEIWFLKLVRNDLDLHPNDKPEYRMKNDEKIKFLNFRK